MADGNRPVAVLLALFAVLAGASTGRGRWRGLWTATPADARPPRRPRKKRRTSQTRYRNGPTRPPNGPVTCWAVDPRLQAEAAGAAGSSPESMDRETTNGFDVRP